MTSKQLKEEGMLQVLDNEPDEWKKRYATKVPEFLKTTSLFLGEDVTKWMREKGIGEPHHENAWGAMFNASIARSGFVIRTGKTRLATADKSHAHAFRLWLSLLCAEGVAVTLNQQLFNLGTQVKTKKLDLLSALKKAAELGAESISEN